MKVGVLATMIFGALIGYPIASLAGLAPDADGDGVPNVIDKCMTDSRNVAMSCDTDTDGYGNVCDGDFNQNGVTNSVDFAMYFAPALTSVGFAASRGVDMNCNGTVNAVDFGMNFVPDLGTGYTGSDPPSQPGPSGLPCAGSIGCI